jgi:mono/diheme cytochrome c family protein
MLFTLLAFVTPVHAQSDTPAAPNADYRVEQGKVDGKTFVGWRLYHETCVTCHGADGISTGSAPNLLERIAAYTPKEFSVKVLNRYLVSVPSDTAASESGSAVREAFITELRNQEAAQKSPLTMPEWQGNPLIQDRVSAIYAYLKARADGALQPGRPQLLKDAGD